MVAKQLYRTETSRETWDGGYAHMVRRVEREQPSSDDLLRWRFDLTDTPKSERGPFWMGMRAATYDALDAALERLGSP